MDDLPLYASILWAQCPRQEMRYWIEKLRLCFFCRYQSLPETIQANATGQVTAANGAGQRAKIIRHVGQPVQFQEPKTHLAY